MRKNRHIIVGTAGHVDHGKTELVKALTGVNTDRLREEQERGISIELGFAELQLPSGERVGLVDVPGHERFVKAMVAGAAGMDLGMLLVGADESVMPQTREHLDIMSLLAMRAGIIVISKSDLADEETLDLVEAEIDDMVRGTFLESAPRIRTSARTGHGLDALRLALEKLTATVAVKPADSYFRLPVDRVFGLAGIGLVVTGTAWSGEVREGDTLELLPGGQLVRVRGLQVHAEKRPSAVAGERVAINLHGVKHEDVQRGSMVVTPGVLRASFMIDARVSLLPSVAHALRNRARVRVHHGSTEVLGRVVLLDRDELEPGDAAPAQLRLEEPLVTERGDRIVLRFYSPTHTLGGAQVVDPAPAKHKRFRQDVLDAVQLLESGGPSDLVVDAIRRAGVSGRNLSQLRDERIASDAALAHVLDHLRSSGLIVQVGERDYETAVLRKLGADLRRLVQEFQRANPLAWGIGRAELQERSVRGVTRADFARLLEYFAAQEGGAGTEKLHLRPDAVRAGSAARQLSVPDQTALARIETALRDAAFAPPSAKELQDSLHLGEQLQAFLGLLEEDGRLVRIGDGLAYHANALGDIESKVTDFFAGKTVMSMAEFKDMTGLSRKYAVPLLEYFDRKGVTSRDGDVRRPGPRASAGVKTERPDEPRS